MRRRGVFGGARRASEGGVPLASIGPTSYDFHRHSDCAWSSLAPRRCRLITFEYSRGSGAVRAAHARAPASGARDRRGTSPSPDASLARHPRVVFSRARLVSDDPRRPSRIPRRSGHTSPRLLRSARARAPSRPRARVSSPRRSPFPRDHERRRRRLWRFLRRARGHLPRRLPPRHGCRRRRRARAQLPHPRRVPPPERRPARPGPAFRHAPAPAPPTRRRHRRTPQTRPPPQTQGPGGPPPPSPPRTTATRSRAPRDGEQGPRPGPSSVPPTRPPIHRRRRRRRRRRPRRRLHHRRSVHGRARVRFPGRRRERPDAPPRRARSDRTLGGGGGGGGIDARRGESALDSSAERVDHDGALPRNTPGSRNTPTGAGAGWQARSPSASAQVKSGVVSLRGDAATGGDASEFTELSEFENDNDGLMAQVRVVETPRGARPNVRRSFDFDDGVASVAAERGAMAPDPAGRVDVFGRNGDGDGFGGAEGAEGGGAHTAADTAIAHDADAHESLPMPAGSNPDARARRPSVGRVLTFVGTEAPPAAATPDAAGNPAALRGDATLGIEPGSAPSTADGFGAAATGGNTRAQNAAGHDWRRRTIPPIARWRARSKIRFTAPRVQTMSPPPPRTFASSANSPRPAARAITRRRRSRVRVRTRVRPGSFGGVFRVAAPGRRRRRPSTSTDEC